MSALGLPRRPACRPTAATTAVYEADLAAFCEAILELRARSDFRVSARGWAYILEEHGLDKGDFDACEDVINACRKSGDLPLDICAEDSTRQAGNLEDIDDNTPEESAASTVRYVANAYRYYTPLSFWEDQDVYLEMAVEKIDLKSLFARDCSRYCVPLTNARGWNDMNSRAAMMRRFAYWEARGKQCFLLYCGDHDPTGLNISTLLKSNMADLSKAVGWSPDNLIVDRFGLNADFIERERLTWIDGLATGNKKMPNLESPRHPDHNKPYVQDYIARFGARKVEANALVVRPEAGRELCRQAILRYLPEDAPEAYEARLAPLREQVRALVLQGLAEAYGGEAAP